MIVEREGRPDFSEAGWTKASGFSEVDGRYMFGVRGRPFIVFTDDVR